MIITLLPNSILLAIADSPASLQMLTANSVRKAIPVIFNRILRKELLMPALLLIDCSKLIIEENFPNTKENINTPAINETYTANSDLYCFIIIIIIKEINPIPIIFITSSNSSSFQTTFKDIN